MLSRQADSVLCAGSHKGEDQVSSPVSRREFLQASSALAGAVALPPGFGATAARPNRGPFRGTLCLFSKPVPQLTRQELARSARIAGFGPDGPGKGRVHARLR